MKALVLKANADLKVEEREVPVTPETGTLLIKVAACGVCGSDIPRGFQNGAYHYPLVMGHEFSGIVDEEVAGSPYRKGDYVTIFPLIPTDPSEEAYQSGDYALCKSYDYFGSRRDGAFQEYLRVPEFNIFKIPDHVDLIHASMTEPAAVALHGARKLHISTGDIGLVIGGGPIGNMTAQWLRILGCEQVMVVDIDPVKLKIAEEMGFTIINSSERDPVKEVMRITDGRGIPRVVEACGLPVTFLQAIESASVFGEVVFMGNIHGTFSINEKEFSSILRRELSIFGTWNSKIEPRGNDDWTTVLNKMDRELEVGPLISDLVDLDKGPEIFDSIRYKKRFHNKVIFKIGG
jgi:L-iditol 2-dehydrogenase/galactitol-1-phosphate 5-dehydrogenase